MVFMLYSSLQSYVGADYKEHDFDVNQLDPLSLVLSYGTCIGRGYHQGAERAGGETFRRQCVGLRLSLYNML